MPTVNQKSAISAIQKSGVLLVFPIDNRKEPASLWSHFHPRKPMRWEWDENGDDSVGNLWHLRAALSTTRKAVYTKWYRGRATYFSVELFPAILRSLNPGGEYPEGLSKEAGKILSVLEGESPLSTKEIKRISELKGKESERVYEKAMKELWSRLLIVAFGEVEDGAFPSLAVGSTKVLFEDLWNKAFKMKIENAEKQVQETLKDSLFHKFYLQLKKTGLNENAASKKKTQKRRNSKQVTGVISFEDL